MFLKNLQLHNFKNIAQADMDFSARVNCFIGDNAAGKTNLLDAIYYLSFCKSYFNAIDSQNIRHEAPYFSITGKYDLNSHTTDTIQCVQKRNQKKSFKLNKKEYDRLSDHIGLYPLVMISPYDRDLINEGSDVRRRFIDTIISQFDKVYLDDLISYNKVLAQRNALLKNFAESRTFHAASLQIWDEQLAQLGMKIYPLRRRFLEAYTPVFERYFQLISGGAERVEIHYETQLKTSLMAELLAESLQRDRASRFTNVGIHKDDLILNIQGYPVKKFGSQGQQKSFIVALRLAQYEYIRELKGYKPIMLLDDIFDKLDDKRVEQLIQLTSENNFGQVFITDTQRERIEHLLEKVNADHRIYHIRQGVPAEVKNHTKPADHV
ncbi:MAG: DNA replication/repair protein RecF [Bacteroidales bacterium]|jgi:DNA replication and repair protein RecF|nr:DNA replication/repair protein RecF [Bacteroidales bacterium]MDD2630876.1 DNA replication/repair protein RecF [Bacteroidales bacterium]MDD3131073.1 DNA replication/repair protein RecF [Bacteroidales bacterium]MDD4176481.1 DNA replication/repair protein RecF [Bacteroidales bacterium]MDY0335629.1 DNA replication/repair protein RecF [Bacteroidales bacterium]